MENFETLMQKAMELGLTYAPKLLLAVITLVVGLWLVGKVVKLTARGMTAAEVDPTLIPFLTSLVSWGLKILLLVSVASMIGIATTSFIAVLGAAGLAVGLALQGSLGNFAGGVLILLFKPYKVGDLVEASGHVGVVKEVQIFNTILVTPQNKRVIIPNGVMSNSFLVNYSAEGTLRVDLSIGISYESDIDAAKKVLSAMLEEEEKVLSEPAPYVGVEMLADSSVNLVVRPWCQASDYWDVYFRVTEMAKKTLDRHDITIPFPQRDVHIYEHKRV